MFRLILIYILILLSSVPSYAMFGQRKIVVHKTITVNEEKTDFENTTQGLNEGPKKTTAEAKSEIVTTLLAGNRDFKKSQEITKDETLGGIAADLKFENRYVAGADHVEAKKDANGNVIRDEKGNVVTEIVHRNGFEEMGSDMSAIAELPTNLPLALGRVNTSVGDVGNVAANTATGKISVGEAVDLVGNVKIGKLRDQKEAENKNNEIADSVNNLLGGNAENARETLKTEVNSTTATLGGSNTNANGSQRETYVYDEIIAPNQTMMTPDGQIINKNEAAAITETNSKDIGFDMRNPELQNGVEVQKITTHEASHRAGYGEGASALLGNVAADVWAEQNKANNRATNTATDPVVTQANFLANPANAPTLQAGNDWVGNVKEGETLPYNKLVQASNQTLQNNYGPRWRDPSTGDVSKIPLPGYIPRKISHKGTDISAPKNSIINAAADGEVEKIGWVKGYGNTVVLKHDTDSGTKWSVYAHMTELPSLQKGQNIIEGQKIGEVGNSGLSTGTTGNHLHFGINEGDSRGNFSYGKGWVNPQNINIGKYDNLKDTPAYKEGKAK